MKKTLCKSVYIIGMLVACGAAHAQVSLPSVGNSLPQLPTGLDADRETQLRLERGARNATQLAERWIDTAELTVEQTAEQASGLASGVLRELHIAADPTGAEIENRIIVVLVDSEKASGFPLAGNQLIARRDLKSLGMTMLTLRVPVGTDLPETVEQLRSNGSDVAIDYNHLYGFSSTSQNNAIAADETRTAEIDESASAGNSLRIGIIDSAVMPGHRGVSGVEVINKDFVTTPGLRPETHGTAVASLIAKSAKDDATIYAASVFFQLPNRAPGATAESLVAALDWLVQEKVDAINMSLAGPGNALLETAIARLVEKNTVIVAAVGNNGPKGQPLYPAAYDGVIGITAVDKKNKVFRYANRGEQVKFAAVGVNVKVADSMTGGWRIESGTSMASPHVTVVVSKLLRSQTVPAEAVQSWLMANSKDLGRKGFDPVYGYGLITQPPIVMSANQN